MNRGFWLGLLGGLLCLVTGCTDSERSEIVAAFPLDDLADVVTQSEELSIDLEETFDGGGSLHIDAGERGVIRLFEIEAPEVAQSRLTLHAQLKCIGVAGRAYLEIWCRIPGEGDFFSRGLSSAIGHVTDWRPSRISYDLRSATPPDRIRINLVMEKSGGHVWIDDVKLIAEPLPADLRAD